MLQSYIADLLKSGLSEKEIADRAGCTQPTVNRLKNGKQSDTSSRIADAIRVLHRERCPAEGATI